MTLGADLVAAIPVVMAVLLVISLCRWAFGSRGVRQVVGRPDYGLLTPVARVNTAPDAEAVQRRLADDGIRSTVAPAGKGFDSRGIPWPPGAQLVLVFPADVERATTVLAARH